MPIKYIDLNTLSKDEKQSLLIQVNTETQGYVVTDTGATLNEATTLSPEEIETFLRNHSGPLDTLYYFSSAHDLLKEKLPEYYAQIEETMDYEDSSPIKPVTIWSSIKQQILQDFIKLKVLSKQWIVPNNILLICHE